MLGRLCGQLELTSVESLLGHIAAEYLDINCACFTPITGLIEDVVRLAREYRADGIPPHGVDRARPDAETKDAHQALSIPRNVPTRVRRWPTSSNE